MENLLKETLEKLAAHGKSPADVRYVVCSEPDYLASIGKPRTLTPFGSWNDFAGFADFDYDDGYGGAEVNGEIKIVGDDWWLERGEYDGSEWWEFKTLPKRPVEPTPLRPADLRDR